MNKTNIFGLFFVLFLISCTTVQESQPTSIETGSSDETNTDLDWRDYPLNDINSGEDFKISDFKGQKILLESFAVWCPTCTKQQRVFQELIKEGDETIHISLDTDPNEDASLVKEHTTQNGFSWRYVITPATMTKSLINEFGISVVNAPSAPVILVCEDQSARLLKRGLKDSGEIKDEVAKGC